MDRITKVWPKVTAIAHFHQVGSQAPSGPGHGSGYYSGQDEELGPGALYEDYDECERGLMNESKNKNRKKAKTRPSVHPQQGSQAPSVASSTSGYTQPQPPWTPPGSLPTSQHTGLMHGSSPLSTSAIQQPNPSYGNPMYSSYQGQAAQYYGPAQGPTPPIPNQFIVPANQHNYQSQAHPHQQGGYTPQVPIGVCYHSHAIYIQYVYAIRSEYCD